MFVPVDRCFHYLQLRSTWRRPRRNFGGGGGNGAKVILVGGRYERGWIVFTNGVENGVRLELGANRSKAQPESPPAAFLPLHLIDVQLIPGRHFFGRDAERRAGGT